MEGSIATFTGSDALHSCNVDDRIKLPISGYEDESINDYNFENKYTVTGKELFYVISAGFEHGLNFEYYKFHLSEKSGSPKRYGFKSYVFGKSIESETPHDISGKYGRLQPEFAVLMAVNNKDPKNNFKPFGKAAVDFHRLSNHHLVWNNLNGNGTIEDFNEAGLDAVMSQMEKKGRGYQNGDKKRSIEEVRDVIYNRKVEERRSNGEFVWNTNTIHAAFMGPILEDVIKIPDSKIPSINNKKDFYDFKEKVLKNIKNKKKDEPLTDYEFTEAKAVICFENALNMYEKMGFEF